MSYFAARAQEALTSELGQVTPTTALERKLWARLVRLEAAALRVLSDVDDDGVAERSDVAITELRAAC
ncbi:MAG: hypothetical protein QM750_19715 [Rubrivivax sp.]